MAAAPTEARSPTRNAGKITGFGPVHFGMSPSDALRAAGHGAQYTTWQSFEETRWRVEYDDSGHHVEARFRSDETISHFVIIPLTRSDGIRTRGDCLEQDAERYKIEFDTVFPGLTMADSREQNHTALPSNTKRTATFADGSSVSLNVYYISDFGMCGANMMVLPPPRPNAR